jgi:hypothetical protein
MIVILLILLFQFYLFRVRTLSDVFACQGISLRDPETGPEPVPAALHGSLRETPCQAFERVSSRADRD